MEKIKKSALSITNLVDEIISGNPEPGDTKSPFINEATFEFGDEHDSYKTREFKEILDKHFDGKNIVYSFKEIGNHTAEFNIKFTDWITEDE